MGRGGGGGGGGRGICVQKRNMAGACGYIIIIMHVMCMGSFPRRGTQRMLFVNFVVDNLEFSNAHTLLLTH